MLRLRRIRQPKTFRLHVKHHHSKTQMHAINATATVEYHAIILTWNDLRLQTPSLMQCAKSTLRLCSRHIIITPIARTRTALLATEPSTEPAGCLCGLVLDNSIELVCGLVDLLASLVQLLLGFCLGLLVLLLRLGTIGIELLLEPFSFGLGLVGLQKSVNCRRDIGARSNIRIAVRWRVLLRSPPRPPSLPPCPDLGSLLLSCAQPSRHRLYSVSSSSL